MTEPAQPALVFLSDFITDIPPARRVAFIRSFKNAIRTGVFEGAPVADKFKLTFQGRNADTRQGESKTEEHRDYAVKSTPDFETWLAKQQAVDGKQGGVRYPSKADLLSGEADFGKAVAQYRRRGHANSKRTRARA